MAQQGLFSQQAVDYAAARPTYPDALFDCLLAHTSRGKEATVWDCACGNGQASVGLAQRFADVVATDLSEAQLKLAPPHPHIRYQQASAEACPLPEASVDLVCVAQALHWFNLPVFFRRSRARAAPRRAIGGVELWPQNARTRLVPAHI